VIHNVDAIYDGGVLRPTEPLALPEGARVRLRVEEENGAAPDTVEYGKWLDSVAGRWQGEFVRANEGDAETRAPLS
jgi:predicted DNA-binding antitoxin AbrB/MazE fold protein